jgi:hypothetical protein
MIQTAVWSLWSRPYAAGARAFTRDDARMLALSVALARRHFKKLVLYCDSPFRGLAEHLPFDEVRELRVIEGFDHIWALGKLTTYAAMDEPFIHIDHDVFLFKPPAPVMGAPVLAERAEPWRRAMPGEVRHPRDRVYWYPENELRTAVHPLPPGWDAALRRDNQLAYNAGILGGTDHVRIAAYAQKSLAALGNGFANMDGGFASVFLEQYALAVEFGRFVTTLLPPILRPGDAEALGYTHLIAAKTRPEWMEKVERKLRSVDARLADAISGFEITAVDTAPAA